MSMMLEAKTVSTYIDCPPTQVYDYVHEPKNLPLWAKSFVHSAFVHEDGWKIETSLGQLGVRFAARNSYGVLDHTLRLPNGEDVVAPMRVIQNGDGSEVLFTNFRRPTQSESDFSKDQEMVLSDLRSLKIILEVE